MVRRILSFSSSPKVAFNLLAKAERSCVNGTIPGVISEKSNSLEIKLLSDSFEIQIHSLGDHQDQLLLHLSFYH